MKKHRMTLQPEPFEQVRSGRKTIELRLYDPKRQAIVSGDEIRFTRADRPEESVTVRVGNLHRFDSFEELYASLPLDKCGYDADSLSSASPSDMNAYYSMEEQLLWGVVGIEVAVPDPEEERLTRISRFLSLVLRHDPAQAGVRLDRHGWADVQELLAGVSRRYPIDLPLLERIVAEDSKQRYSFSENRTRIRANQGHSVPVDVEPEELTPPEYLWHGTASRFTGSIDTYGLKPMSRLHVHLSADPDTAAAVGARHGSPFVYRVCAGRMSRDGYRFYRSANGVWLTKYVPACYLEKAPFPETGQ